MPEKTRLKENYLAIFFVVIFTIASCKGSSQPTETDPLKMEQNSSMPALETEAPKSVAPSRTNTPTISITVEGTPTQTATMTATVTPESTAEPKETPLPYEEATLYGLMYREHYLYQPRGTYGRLGIPVTIDGIKTFADLESGGIEGPVEAISFEFANFRNLIAYWTYSNVGKLWISDLLWTNPELIYVDQDGVYPNGYYSYPEILDLSFTPDDRHLILQVSDQPELSMIYHLENKQLEAWPYDCDRVARAPVSNQPAVWCEPNQGAAQYAVLEWGGENPVQRGCTRRSVHGTSS